MNKCKWAQGDFDEICVNADCPMCADFCPVLVQPGVCRFEDRGKRTNADKIRAMTDAELANWITRHTECEDWQCPVFYSCKAALEIDEYDNPLCADMILNWLRQEVEG